MFAYLFATDLLRRNQSHGLNELALIYAKGNKLWMLHEEWLKSLRISRIGVMNIGENESELQATFPSKLGADWHAGFYELMALPFLGFCENVSCFDLSTL